MQEDEMTQPGVCRSFVVFLNIYRDDILNFSISKVDKKYLCINGFISNFFLFRGPHEMDRADVKLKLISFLFFQKKSHCDS